MKCPTLFFNVLFLILASQSHALLGEENGSFKLDCGSRSSKVIYRTVVDLDKPFQKKFAILIDGSPATHFFSDNSPNFQAIFSSLIESGYKVLEIKYPKRYVQTRNSDFAYGFYAACLHQGLEAAIKHDGDLYDAIVKELKYDSTNHRHQLVGFGFSIGATKLQSMAFTLGKPFDRIGLAGVLHGDVENGSKADLTSSSGISWASFIQYAKQISSDALGCAGTEFTSKYNFENQSYFTASNLAMFEGQITSQAQWEAAANPGQVDYIAQKRRELGAPTQIFKYTNCGHDVIKCGGNQIVYDVVTFLTSGGEPVFDIAGFFRKHRG